MDPWRKVILIAIQILNLSKIEHGLLVVEFIHFSLVILRSVPNIHLTGFRLSETYENNWSLGDYRSNHERGENHNKNWAEGQTKMAWMPVYISEGVLEEESEFLPAALLNIVFIVQKFVCGNFAVYWWLTDDYLWFILCLLPVWLDGWVGELLLIWQVLYICADLSWFSVYV